MTPMALPARRILLAAVLCLVLPVLPGEVRALAQEPETAPANSTQVSMTVRPFLMFTGQAEEAMSLYVGLFDDGAILSLDRYGEGEQGEEGSVRLARFRLSGQEFLCIDSPPVHEFSFTPSLSIHVTCPTVGEVDTLYSRLIEGGEVLMPLDSYPFSERYAWLNDRFGVSWQIQIAEGE